MEFHPIRAACIFGGIVSLPAVPFLFVYGGKAPLAAVLIFAGGVTSAVLFGFGARLAPAPHRIKSLVVAVLLTWTFSHSLDVLSSYIPFGSEIVQGIVAAAFNFTFVFLAGWRLAPCVPNKAHV